MQPAPGFSEGSFFAGLAFLAVSYLTTAGTQLVTVVIEMFAKKISSRQILLNGTRIHLHTLAIITLHFGAYTVVLGFGGEWLERCSWW